jgi:hypothetical protein
MPEDPVITAATTFRIAITALAKSAPSTASIDDFLQLRNGKLRLDYREKMGLWQWRLACE